MLPVCVATCHAGAALVNARELLLGLRPTPIGVAGSVAYFAVWLGYAFVAGRRRHCRSVRRMAVAWAVLVGGTAICGSLLRQNLGSGLNLAGGWSASALLVAVAAPLYGLAGLFSTDALTALVGVALGSAVLTMSSAQVGRRLRPTTGPVGAPVSAVDRRALGNGPRA